MNSLGLLSQKVNLLFVLIFFTSNWASGQSFFKTYPIDNFIEKLEISETYAGFSLEFLLKDFTVNPSGYNYNITTDASGNLTSSTDYPGLDNSFLSFFRLANGNFIRLSGPTSSLMEFQLRINKALVILNFRKKVWGDF